MKKITLMLLAGAIAVNIAAQKNKTDNDNVYPSKIQKANVESGIDGDDYLKFNVANKRVVTWKDVFNTTKSFNGVKMDLKVSGLFENVEHEDSVIFGFLKPLMLDHKAVGGTDLGTKPFIKDMKYSGFVVVEKTNNGYLVTLKKIVTVMDTGIKIMGVDGKGMTYQFEEWAIDKSGKWKSNFVGKPGKMLNEIFYKMFADIF